MDKKRNYVTPEVEVAVNIDVTVGVQMASSIDGGGSKPNPWVRPKSVEIEEEQEFS